VLVSTVEFVSAFDVLRSHAASTDDSNERMRSRGVGDGVTLRRDLPALTGLFVVVTAVCSVLCVAVMRAFPSSRKSVRIAQWLSAVLFTGASFLLAPLAQAASCKISTTRQPFLQWGDSATYELTSGGDFETTAWTLSSGAQRIAGSDPKAITGTLGGWSLSLPASGMAKSPLTCIAGNDPSVRFMIAGTGQIAVDLLYSHYDIHGAYLTAPGSWTPSPVVLPGSTLPVANAAQITVELTGLSGTPQIDDVFVDPWSRGG
jgi:hypothetical protein